MVRLTWPVAVVVAFVLGWAAAKVAHRPPPDAERARHDVQRLAEQVTTLDLTAARQSAPRAPADAVTDRSRGADASATASVLSAAVTESAVARPRSGARDGAATRSAAPTPATVEAVLDRFYRYLEATAGGEGRERWRQARELVDELRGMGDVAAQALMRVLATGADTDERRAAARLLGWLQVPQALPLLKDVIEKDQDTLLRRAAATALRQLQTPESLPVMEHILANAGEDRMVRLSAAYGLAEAGRPQGVSGLTHIFQESTLDGRGREIAFRALASLDDGRALPFMRQVVTAEVEPAYRLRAIRYVATQGDQQSLAALRLVMTSASEQPSLRDAAAQAYRALGGR